MKGILLTTLLTISSAIYAQPYQSNFFNNGFGGNVWSNFNQEFQRFSNEMRQMQNENVFGAQTNRYFDDKTNHYMIEIKVDGLGKEDLDITTKDGMIHIVGSVQEIKKTPNGSHSSSRKFSQSYSLPVDADGDNVNAEFNDGVLAVSILKLDKPKSNKVSIQ
ncbi:MAG: Hsp20 family protein [Candidatus Thioglobus sp.]|nr:Hsp20 family protein [Candidatus Thioglobus pontius]MBL6977167.1 Hsp20 family protein [Candidatus Thioglobus sp.]MBL6984731.1 Hsp20 family protein [Candidatus Thioglobus sp.]